MHGIKVCEIPVTPPWTLAALMLGHESLYFLCFLLLCFLLWPQSSFDTHPRWPPVMYSHVKRSISTILWKIGDCEQSKVKFKHNGPRKKHNYSWDNNNIK